MQFDISIDFQAGDVIGWWSKKGVVSYDQLNEEASNRNYCIGKQKLKTGATLQLDWSDNDSDTSISYRDYAIWFDVEYNCD